MRHYLRTCNWAVLAFFLFVLSFSLFGDETLNEGNSIIATLLVVIALTSMVWVPIVAVTSFVSLYLEIKYMLEETKSMLGIITLPSFYVLLVVLLLVYIMFGG